MLRTTIVRGCALAVLTVAFLACSDDPIPTPNEPTLLEVQLDESGNHLNVTVFPALREGETLHVRIRQGGGGVLNCASMAGQITRIDSALISTGDGHTFRGPQTTPVMFEPAYDTRWLEMEAPTGDMLNHAIARIHTIDLCVMKGNEVIRAAELDISRALDREGSGKFDGYGDANEVIASPVAYAEACVNSLGEIPFFEKIGERDYLTYSCLDSTPIPMTVTHPDGTVEYPEVRQDKCDNPQFIYNSCEPNAVDGRTNGPRVASRVNEQGTHWVLLCRKAQEEEGQYDDVAMLGHNPYTGKTCYFQNALYSKTDGVHVPHPGDDVSSDKSTHTSASLWQGIHGGLGNGIECARCHDADPFIHTPWIDGAKDEKGDPIIPMLGVDDGFSVGFNDAPYVIIGTESQGWTMPKHITSPEAAACTKCHRMGNGRWARSWLRRLDHDDTFWDRLLTAEGMAFENYYWMPTNVENLDEATWADSEYGKALDFIQACAQQGPVNTENLDQAALNCQWQDLPTEQIADVGELPEIELEGPALALEALKVLGAAVSDPNDPMCTGENGSCATRRCGECHSVSRGGLKHWQDLTKAANRTCGLTKDPTEMTPEEAFDAVQCLRAQKEDANSVFAADKLGILTTGVRYGYFRKLFQAAYPGDTWLPQYVQFKARVGMPKGTYSALSEKEYAIVKKWFDSDLKSLDEVIEDPPAPTTCENFIDTEAMSRHLDDMRFNGWEAVNRSNGMRMHGCPGDSPSACFGESSYRDRTSEWSAGKGQLKELLQLQFRTSFWTRSSADGRFVANGGGVNGGATVTDLLRGKDIRVKASYDPGFFPDNSGFIYQGGGTGICSMSVLETEDEIDFEEEGCMRGTNINLYQHVARGTNGSDYFIINSQFTSDSGRNDGTKNPVAHFDGGATMKFSPMAFNGTTYEQLNAVIVDSPFEGDSVLSPSGKLVISRLAGGPEGSSLGYVIREVTTSKFESSYQIGIDKVVARFCVDGAKANISFDERFFVTHRYQNGASDIVLMDMVTGIEHPVTRMPEGSAALFPHFRSDGWFYFLVRHESEEFVVASDLAIQLQAEDSGLGQ